MADFIAELVGAVVEWLLRVLPLGCLVAVAIFTGLALIVGFILVFVA